MSNCENCRANGICDVIVGDCEQTDKIAGKIYQQGRADAIDEFVDSIINPKNYERYDFDDCISDSNKANDFFTYVFAMAEQLKEQK